MDFRRIDTLFREARRLDPQARRPLLAGLTQEERAELETLLAHHDDERGLSLDPAVGRLPDPAPTDAGPPPREWIDGFRIVRRLGAGGMGTVYEAEQLEPARRVALKVLHGASRDGRRRFRIEAQALALLAHPNVAAIHAQGVVDTGQGHTPYLVMELIDGVPLDVHCRGRPQKEVIELLMRVADGVAHAHQRGVIHRDLKPENILVTSEGVPKIVDFGLARQTGMEGSATQVGTIMGTLGYMSPEQAGGDTAAIDTRTDVYALGVIAYELLSGRSPYDLSGCTLPEAVRIIREAPPRESGLDAELDLIVRKAMEKDREGRYAAASDLREDLRRHVASEPVLARPASATYQLRKFVGRHRAMVAGFAAMAAVLVGATAVSLYLADQAMRAEAHTRHVSAIASLQAAAAHLRVGDAGNARRLLEGIPAEERAWEWRVLFARTDESESAVPIPADHRPLCLGADGRTLIVGAGPAGRSTYRELLPGAGAFGVKVTLEDSSRQATLEGGVTRFATLVDDALCVQDMGSGRCETLPGPWARISAMTTSPGGERTLVAHGARFNGPSVLSVFDADGLRTVTGPLGERVFGLAYTPDQHTVAVVGDTGYFALVDVATGAATELDSGHSRHTSCVAISTDGAWIFTGADDGLVRVYDRATGGLVKRLRGHLGKVTCLAVLPDGRIVSGSHDRSLRVWDPVDGTPLQMLLGHEEALTGVAASADGRRLTSSGRDAVRRWRIDRSRVQRPHAQDARHPFVYGVAVSPDGTRIVTCGWDGTARVTDTASRRVLAVLRMSQNYPRSVTFSWDGRHVVVLGGGVNAFSAETGRLVATTGDLRGMRALAAHPSAGRVAICRRSDVACLDVAAGLDAVRTWPIGNAAAVAFTRDAAHVAIGLRDGSVVIVEETGDQEALRWQAHDGTVHDLVYSADGRTLASASEDGKAAVWDAATGRLVRPLAGHRGRVYAVAFSPDGSRLASGGDDGVVRIWDTATGEERVQFDGHEDYVKALAFTPDGSTLVSASGDNTVRLWSSRSEADWIAWGDRILALEEDVREQVAAWADADPEDAASRIAAHPWPDEDHRLAARNVLLRIVGDTDE